METKDDMKSFFRHFIDFLQSINNMVINEDFRNL